MKKMWLEITAGVLLLLLLFIYLTSPDLRKKTIEPVVTPVLGGKRTLTGAGICLPPKHTTSPQTLECAYGIKAPDGNYAVSLPEEVIDAFKVGQQMTIEGYVVPIEAISANSWQKYDVQGIVQVEKLQ